MASGWVVGGLLVFVVGCGSSSGAKDAGGGNDAVSGSAGTNNVGGGAVAGGAGMGTGGSTSTSGSSAGGVGGVVPSVEARKCTGSFPAPTLLFAEPAEFRAQAVSVTADQLELFYVQLARRPSSEPAPWRIMRKKRASIALDFGPSEPLLELDGGCEANDDVNLDVSEDGLSIYLTCTEFVVIPDKPGPSQLRVARRAERALGFSLEPGVIGSVFGAASLSADELTAYGNGPGFEAPPVMYVRSSKSESFGEAMAVEGLDGDLRSPDVSSDGLVVFGSAADPITHSGYFPFRATRAAVGAAFEPPVMLGFGLPGSFGAPNITPDCSLYFQFIANAGGSSYETYVSRMQ